MQETFIEKLAFASARLDIGRSICAEHLGTFDLILPRISRSTIRCVFNAKKMKNQNGPEEVH